MRIICLVCKLRAIRMSIASYNLWRESSRAAVCMRYIDPPLHRSIIGDILENVRESWSAALSPLEVTLIPVQWTILIFARGRLTRFNFWTLPKVPIVPLRVIAFRCFSPSRRFRRRLNTVKRAYNLRTFAPA